MSRADFHEPTEEKASKWIVSARMNPRSKSVWITPAACGAVELLRIVQARISFSPAVN